MQPLYHTSWVQILDVLGYNCVTMSKLLAFQCLRFFTRESLVITTYKAFDESQIS